MEAVAAVADKIKDLAVGGAESPAKPVEKKVKEKKEKPKKANKNAPAAGAVPLEVRLFLPV